MSLERQPVDHQIDSFLSHIANRFVRNRYDQSTIGKKNLWLSDEKRGIRVLKRILANQSEHDASELMCKLDKSTTGPQGLERTRAIRALLGANLAKTFIEIINQSGIDERDVPGLLKNEGVYSLVSAMLSDPIRNGLRLGIFFSEVGIDNLPEKLSSRLPHQKTETKMTIQTIHGDWTLCEQKEQNAYAGINKGKTAAAGEKGTKYFFVVDEGKLALLCLSSLASKKGGFFHEGYWYCPINSEARDYYQNSIGTGEKNLDLFPGDYVFMRPVIAYNGKSAQEVFEDYKHAAARYGSRLSPAKVTRSFPQVHAYRGLIETGAIETIPPQANGEIPVFHQTNGKTNIVYSI